MGEWLYGSISPGRPSPAEQDRHRRTRQPARPATKPPAAPAPDRRAGAGPGGSMLPPRADHHAAVRRRGPAGGRLDRPDPSAVNALSKRR